MRKNLILSVITVLILLSFTVGVFAGETPTPNPNNFIAYKSPQGLFEVKILKGMSLMREHKDGVVYGSQDQQMIVAAGVRLFSEKDDVKVDLPYIEKQLKDVIKDITGKGGKVLEGPKKYKKGILLLVETMDPPFPPKEEPKEGEAKPKYYVNIYATTKNEKSLAIIVYLPEAKYEALKNDIEFMIDNLK